LRVVCPVSPQRTALGDHPSDIGLLGSSAARRLALGFSMNADSTTSARRTRDGITFHG